MGRRGPQLRNDVERRFEEFVASRGGGWFWPERDFARLDKRHLARWIKELRAGEASLRKLRKRLEALQGAVERPCPAPIVGGEGVCNRPVVGRVDAVYCCAECRLRAHRAKRVAERENVTP